MFQPWRFGAPPQCHADLVGDLGRDVVDGQPGEETEHAVRNAERHRDQIGIAERRKVREPVQSEAEWLEHARVAHGVERSRMDAESNRIHRAEDPAVLTEHGHRGAELVVLARF